MSDACDGEDLEKADKLGVLSPSIPVPTPKQVDIV
jgi:hypothetical protein